MDIQKPNLIPELKNTMIETCIELLRLDPHGGTFAIEHAMRIGFGEPSSRDIRGTLVGPTHTLIETIQALREEDPNAKLVAEDSVRIALRAGLTPRRSAA